MVEKDFGSRVASALQKLRISQSRFAKRCGISQPTLSGIINNGQEPRLGTYRKIERTIADLEREATAK